MNRSCGCHGMAGTTLDWSGSVTSIYANAVNYLGPYWSLDIGIPSVDHVWRILGKYKFYLSKGNVQDTSQGRGYISKIISNDLAIDGAVAVRYAPDMIFKIIQGAAAALRKKQTAVAPDAAIKAGIISRKGGTWADVKNTTSAWIDKEKNELKNAFAIPTWVKWTAGGLFGAAVFAGIKTRIGGR